MEKAAKRHGQGGDFSSGSDYMGLTQSMVERDRAKQTAAYDKTYAKTTDLNSLKDKLMAQATEKAVDSAPIQPSDRMAAVEDSALKVPLATVLLACSTKTTHSLLKLMIKKMLPVTF